MPDCPSRRSTTIKNPATTAAQYTTDASRFVEIDDMRVHYRDQGTGAPLLFLHGMFASLHTWDGWVAELRDTHRCISVDLPGFGLTGPWPRDYTIDSYASFVETFAATIDLTSFAALGHSLGGAIAWHYALDFDRVTHLVLVAPVGYPARRYPLPILIGRLPVVRWLLALVTPRWFVAHSVRSAYGDPQLVTDDTIDRYRDLLTQQGNRTAVLRVIEHLRPERLDELADIDVPTLVLWGMADRWSHPDNATRFGKAIPNCEVRTYDDVGHLIMEECPALTSRDVRTFLSNG